MQNEDSSLVLLSPHNVTQRQGIARRLLAPDKLAPSGGVTKKVHRHLKNGDVLLLNRQPTLHKPSIMAMKVSGSIGWKGQMEAYPFANKSVCTFY